MNKNKKLIALICAMAMIFSVFAGFTIVNAEEATRGFAFENVNVTNEGQTMTMDIVYVGYELGLADFEIHADVPSEVTNITTVSNITGAVDNFANGVYDLTYGGVSNVTAPNNVVATLTLTLSKALSKDGVMKLRDNTAASMMNADESDYTYIDKVSEGNMMASTVTLPKYQDPNGPTEAPEPITTRPPKQTAAPVPTVDPDAPVVPTLKPDVTVTRGFDFKNVNVDGSTVTMDIVYVGYDLGLADFEIHADVPSEVTNITTVSNITGAVDNFANGVYDLTYGGVSNVTAPNNVVATLTLTLSSDASNDFQIELRDNTAASMMNADESDYTYIDKVSEGNMQKAIVTIPVTGGDTPVSTPTAKPSNEYKANEIAKNVDFSEPETTMTVDGETVSNYRIIAKLTNNGADVPYGEDGFVAMLGDKELTEVEYNNLLGGYIDDIKAMGYNTVEEAFNDLTFKVYSDAAGAKIEVQVALSTKDEDGNDVEIVVGGGEEDVTFGKPSDPKKATVTLKAEDKSIVVNTNSRITATVKNPADVTPGTEVVFTITSGTDRLEFTADPDVTTYTATINEKGEATARVSATKKTGRVKIEASYAYTNKNGAQTATDDITVSVVASDDGDNGGSSSNKNNGGGSIAHGPGSQTNTGKVAFTDIDTVPWAEDAILALVDRGVINGRSNTIFDPNGTVTRAEFAKMVVFGFGLTGGNAGNFSDVADTDWYADVVATGYYNGVISGYDDGTFRPNGLISRQEMAAMISRAIGAANKTAPATVDAASFDDAWQIGNWAIDSVTSLQRAGIINGMTETTFEPLANATRAQAAVIINRAINIAK